MKCWEEMQPKAWLGWQSARTIHKPWKCYLIVVSRRTSSGSYAGNKQAWNELQTPLILMSGYLTRDGRWGWTDGSSENADTYEEYMAITVGQEGHPFVSGVTSPVQMFDWSPGHSAPKAVYLPLVNTLRPGTIAAPWSVR